MIHLVCHKKIVKFSNFALGVKISTFGQPEGGRQKRVLRTNLRKRTSWLKSESALLPGLKFSYLFIFFVIFDVFLIFPIFQVSGTVEWLPRLVFRCILMLYDARNHPRLILDEIQNFHFWGFRTSFSAKIFHHSRKFPSQI